FVTFDMASIERQLTDKVRHWGRWRMAALKEIAPPAPVPAPKVDRTPGRRPDLVVVGVSTGGPVTLVELLGLLGPLPCPLVVAQHMPPTFTRGFAASLSRTLKRPVEEGTAGMTVEPGTVTILKGGGDLVIQRAGRFTLRAAPPGPEVYHPSADLLFRSAASEARAPVAVILTGMGDDGTAGARAFAERGHPVLVQDPASCAVDGMPTAAIRAGVASEVLSIAAMGRKLNAWFTL
ncbi:CheB methylesterase domain-containing protein, partial [Azospirillum sp.]|uniref:CheB methylesterase domain-containing protein n=1 Tax=Azospirillum sp. TaxID=34012 RepID=UPI002D4873F4